MVSREVVFVLVFVFVFVLVLLVHSSSWEPFITKLFIC
jgi:hypothetical protein